MALAAPFAAIVMDARTGEVLEADNADTRLHPASLTKMMTLYITFEAIKRGEISARHRGDGHRQCRQRAAVEAGPEGRAEDQAALPDPGRGDQVGQRCATAIGEAIGGSEAAFARG